MAHCPSCLTVLFHEYLQLSYEAFIVLASVMAQLFKSIVHDVVARKAVYDVLALVT